MEKIMSHEDTNTSTYAQKTLTEAKKERKQYEQDAILLSNRIKLLQLEEEKTWKKIEEAKQKKSSLELARKQKEEKLKIKDEIFRKQEKQRELNQKKIQDLKFQIEKSKNKNIRSAEEARKKIAAEIKEMRNQSLQQKSKIYEEIGKENQKRSSSIKVERIKKSIRLKKLEESKQAQAKVDYMNRVAEEVESKNKLALKVSEMEALEIELIKKLQNTQNMQQKVVSELESYSKKPLTAYKY